MQSIPKRNVQQTNRNIRRPVSNWSDPEVPTAGPAGPVIEVNLPCRRSEWHGSF
jgi:hypothetical protein